MPTLLETVWGADGSAAEVVAATAARLAAGELKLTGALRNMNAGDWKLASTGQIDFPRGENHVN